MKSISVTLKEPLMKVNQFRECFFGFVFFFLRVLGIRTGEEFGLTELLLFPL